MNYEIITFTPVFILLVGFIVFSISKKRKRSAKTIYKLIDDLEKNTFINCLFKGKKINQILYQLLLLNLSPNLEDVAQPNDPCYLYQLHLYS